MCPMSPKDVPVIVNCFANFFFFWMHSSQGLLLKGTLLVHHPMPLFPHLHIQGNWAVPTGALGRWIG